MIGHLTSIFCFDVSGPSNKSGRDALQPRGLTAIQTRARALKVNRQTFNSINNQTEPQTPNNMKKTIMTILAMAPVAVSSYGQGTIVFAMELAA